ncbi:hypothetical protein J4401_04180 [Candidatus Woesearchaeota archaeon]|nr:hypothetical protein [Candidatus Woesearchaeota archaeon]
MDKKILPICLIISIFFALSVSAISRSDFQNILLDDNRGSVDDASGGKVIYNIGKGWNLVPLKFIMESSASY